MPKRPFSAKQLLNNFALNPSLDDEQSNDSEKTQVNDITKWSEQDERNLLDDSVCSIKLISSNDSTSSNKSNSSKASTSSNKLLYYKSIFKKFE